MMFSDCLTSTIIQVLWLRRLWIRSRQHFICKHLVHDMPCPPYRTLSLFRAPPFIRIDESSSFKLGNVDNELQSHTRDYPSLTSKTSTVNTAVVSPVIMIYFIGLSRVQYMYATVHAKWYTRTNATTTHIMGPIKLSRAMGAAQSPYSHQLCAQDFHISNCLVAV